MRVSDLIEQLQKFDKNKFVYISIGIVFSSIKDISQLKDGSIMISDYEGEGKRPFEGKKERLPKD